MKGREGNTKIPHTENIQLHCERDHLTSEGDEARLEEGGEHVVGTSAVGVETMALTTLVVLTLHDPRTPGLKV